MRYWNTTVTPCLWSTATLWGYKHLGLVWMQQVAAVRVYWEAQVHPTVTAHPSGTPGCFASSAGGVDDYLPACSSKVLRCCFGGMGWDAACFSPCHTPSRCLCHGPWEKIPPMQGNMGLGGMPQVSDLHLLGVQMQQWKLLGKGWGVPWSWDPQQHHHVRQVHTGLREGWWLSQVSKPICKVIFHFVSLHLPHQC